MAKITVQSTPVTVLSIEERDYISLTDMASAKEGDNRAADIIKNWIRNRYAIEFLGTWEVIHNPDFKVVEFDHFRKSAGLPSFVLSASEWIEQTNAIGIIVLCYGVYEAACLFLNYKRCETSNDAQIEQYISPINIRVPGYVKKVYFTEHQFVHKGDTLLVLDDREYRIRVSEAEAALKDAENGIAILSSSLTTTQATASVYDASIEEINTRISKLQKDLTRYRNLLQRNAATPIQVEQLETELTATLAKLEALKKQKAAATSGVNEVTNRKASVEAGILRAQAALEMARLNLSYTVVTAPCDGTLGRRALEDGQFVQGGQSLTYIIPDTQKWVIANYKETQIANLYEGQKVSIKVDAFPDKEFSGHISAISGATGSKYSLVPTDNSAGNFVKIQQRIPVRIEFDELSEEDNRLLAAGMMVIIKAKL